MMLRIIIRKLFLLLLRYFQLDLKCVLLVLSVRRMLSLPNLVNAGSNASELQRMKRQDFFGGTKPEGATCLFDPCVNIDNYCKNSGTCSLNFTTCMFKCFCAPQYTGPRCSYLISSSTESLPSTTATSTSPSPPVITVNQSIPSTTLRPLEERQCIEGFECINGYCDRNFGFKCACDYGWTGAFCEHLKCPLQCPMGTKCILVNGTFYCFKPETEIQQQTSSTTKITPVIVPNVVNNDCDCDNDTSGFCEQNCCSLQCSHNGTCQKNSQGSEYCVCDTGFYGELCERFDNWTDEFQKQNACSPYYTVRPLHLRECLENFICVYGQCKNPQMIGGSLKLKCECDDGGIGALCQNKCCLQCAEHGKCLQYINGTEYCFCDYDYEGQFCERKIVIEGQKKDTWYLWVVGVCAGVLGVLIMALVIIPYWMWHNRVTVIMKIVHYFQPYEDDDERTWDAFVSYKSADVDQHFVLHTLFPKLEKELGFSLCMHFRDFLPGETIANNIINAVNSSRRTILILTPRYIESEFTRFEYQVAQHEMLKRKHRIIPVLLEDISDSMSSMDPNLRQIIKSVTYIEYPGSDATEKKLNTFWKRMSLSMPKTRSTEEHQKHLENNNKSSESNGINVISINGEISESNNKRETEMTSFTNGGMTPINDSEINLQITEETTVASKSNKNETNGELYNKAFNDD